MATESEIIEAFRTLIRRVSNPELYNPSDAEVKEFFQAILPTVDPMTMPTEATLVCDTVNGKKVLVPKLISDYAVGTTTDPATHIHVSSTYSSIVAGVAYPTIEEAVENATNGKNIIVHAGEYDITDPLVLDDNKKVNIDFEPGTLINVSAGTPGGFIITNADTNITGKGRFVSTSGYPMFKYNVPYEDTIQKLEFLEMDASGIGEFIRFIQGRLNIQGYYGKHTQATANAIIYEGSSATDYLNVNVHQLASKGPVINILSALSGAYISFNSGLYQKLGVATIADSVVAIANCGALVRLNNMLLQNQTDDFNANGISGDGDVDVFLSGVIINCAGVGQPSYSVYSVDNLQSVASCGNAGLYDCTETLGTFLVDPNAPGGEF